MVAVPHMMEVITAGIKGAPRRSCYPPKADSYPESGTEGGISGWLAKRDAACQDATTSGDHSKVLSCEPDKGHAQMLDAFVAEIRRERDVVCGVEEALLATRTCLAAIRSAKEKKSVALEEVV